MKLFSGNFSCLQANFYLERSIKFHIARTYLPTATCVMFSWVSVWLPEEFFTGRIIGSLTLFLTLSAESSAAKEVLPNVSYIKVSIAFYRQLMQKMRLLFLFGCHEQLFVSYYNERYHWYFRLCRLFSGAFAILGTCFFR